MAESMWIKMPDVKGEATDAEHKDEIDIDSYSWGMVHPIDSSGTGQSIGESRASELVVSKSICKATPNLMKFCLNAKSFPEVLLTCRKRGENPIDYLKITMKNAVVSSVQNNGSGEGVAVNESVSFAFTAVKVEYTPQKEDGTPDASVSVEWDFAKQK
jgi:type VI secretion system secreted protein Hcp